MNKYTYTVGRRKTSVASVRLFKGEGESLVNDKPLKDLMVSNKDKAAVIAPLKELDLLNTTSQLKLMVVDNLLDRIFYSWFSSWSCKR